jgi:hypothetical protein
MRHLAFLIAALIGCSSPGEPVPTGQTNAATVAVGDTFTLRPGEIAQISGTQLQVAFRRVENDSRCPQDVTCVWAGDALVQLEVALARTAWVPVALHTTLEPRRAEQFGYTIELVGLSPQPTSTQAIPAQNYSVSLRITRS